MYRLVFLIAVLFSVFSLFAAQEPLKVAVYVDDGAKGIGAVEWVRIVDESPEMTLKLVDGASVRAGALEGQDVFVMPGGSSKAETKSLGVEGCKILKDFIWNGGGFIGTCAGCCVLMDEPKHRINLMPYASCGSTGLTYASFTVNATGAAKLGTTEGHHKIRYSGGPILKATGNHIEGSSFEVWGTYGFEGATKGRHNKSMYNAPAILGGTYGKGKVFATVAHPEYYDSTLYLVEGAFKYVSGRKVTFPKRLHRRGAIAVGFDSYNISGIRTAELVLSLTKEKDMHFVALDANKIFRRNLDNIDVYVYTSPKAFNHKKGIDGYIKDFIARGGKVVYCGPAADNMPKGVVRSPSDKDLVATIRSLW